MSRRASLHLLAIAFYSLLAFLVLHGILFANGSAFAGFDSFNYNWNMWWIRHALTTPGLNVYQSNFVFFPAMNDFGYHALTMFWFPLWVVLEPLVGTLIAFNAIILVCCVLNGYLCFVFLRSEGVSPALALLGGAILQTLPISRYFYYNTHINLMDWFWLPAQLLLWKQIVAQVNAGRRSVIGWIVLQGVALWGLGLTELQFPIFVAILLVPYGLATLWLSPRRGRLIGVGVATLGIALALLWFAGPLPYIARFSGTLAPGNVDVRPGIPFPEGFLTMSPTWWVWSTPSLGAFVPLALLATLIFVRPGPRWRDRWFWFVVMLPPLLLALGPTLTLGSLAIPMPYRMLFALTRGMLGMPWRLAPVFIFAALVFLGKTWTDVLPRLKNFAPLAIAAAFVVMAISFRLYEVAPLQPLPPDYNFYRQIGAERGKPYDDYVVVEVPTGVGTGEVLLGDPRVIQFQYYGMIHGKRMVNGFVSRAPVESFYYVLKDDPMLSWLGQRRQLEPQTVEQQLRQRIFGWPIGYIIVHQDYIGSTDPARQEILGYLNSHDDLICPFIVEKDAVVYRTRWHPDGCPPRIPPEIAPGTYQIDLGASGDEKYIGWGWYWPENIFGITTRWTGAYPQTQVYLNLPPGSYELSIIAQAFWEPRTLKVLVNGTQVGQAMSVEPDQLREYKVQIPASMVSQDKLLDLTLDYDKEIAPVNVGQGSDTRKLAVMVDKLTFRRVGP